MCNRELDPPMLFAEVLNFPTPEVIQAAIQPFFLRTLLAAMFSLQPLFHDRYIEGIDICFLLQAWKHVSFSIFFPGKFKV